VIMRRPPLTKISAVSRRVSILASAAAGRRLFVLVMIASLKIRGIGASFFPDTVNHDPGELI
jgi:hypothetical protein